MRKNAANMATKLKKPLVLDAENGLFRNNDSSTIGWSALFSAITNPTKKIPNIIDRLIIAGGSAPSEYSDHSNVGDRVILHGQVVDKSGTIAEDHLILTVDSEKSIVKVFVNKNNGASVVNKSVDVADTVEITGILDEYEGEKEIVVERSGDVRVI